MFEDKLIKWTLGILVSILALVAFGESGRTITAPANAAGPESAIVSEDVALATELADSDQALNALEAGVTSAEAAITELRQTVSTVCREYQRLKQENKELRREVEYLRLIAQEKDEDPNADRD